MREARRRDPGGVQRLDDQGVRIEDIAVRRPTLDDVFLTLTGHHAEERGGRGISIAATFGDTSVVAKRSLLRIRRQPDLLIGYTVQAVMFVLLFVYVFGGAIHARASTTSTSCCQGSSCGPWSSAASSTASASPTTKEGPDGPLPLAADVTRRPCSRPRTLAVSPTDADPARRDRRRLPRRRLPLPAPMRGRSWPAHRTCSSSSDPPSSSVFALIGLVIIVAGDGGRGRLRQPVPTDV